MEQTISVGAFWIPVMMAAAIPRLVGCLKTVQSCSLENVLVKSRQVPSLLPSSTKLR